MKILQILILLISFGCESESNLKINGDLNIDSSSAKNSNQDNTTSSVDEGTSSSGNGGSTNTSGSGGSTNTSGSGGSTSISTEDPTSRSIPETFVENHNFSIQSSDDGNNFVSSFNVFALPHDENLTDGWAITVKAENGPLYVYATHDVNVSIAAPLIDDDKKFVILQNEGTIVQFTYNSGNFTTNIFAGEVSYSLFKDDAPVNCPVGMIPVKGSYLLQTEGFCVDQNYYSARNIIPSTFFGSEANCPNIAINAGSGTSDIMNYRQFQTILSQSLLYRAGDDMILSSAEKVTYMSQFPKLRTSSASKCTNPQIPSQLYVDDVNFIKLHASQRTFQWRKNSQPSWCQYYNQETTEVLKPSNDLNFLEPQSCTNSSVPSNSMNLNIISDDNGISGVSYPVTSDFYIDTKSSTCDFSILNLFNPVSLEIDGPDFYHDISAIFTSTNTNSYLIAHKTQILRKFDFLPSTSSVGAYAYYRCTYIP